MGQLFTCLEGGVVLAHVSHHGARVRAEDGVGVEINHAVVAAREQVPVQGGCLTPLIGATLSYFLNFSAEKCFLKSQNTKCNVRITELCTHMRL